MKHGAKKARSDAFFNDLVDSVDDLLGIAKHGSGDKGYLIRFHYLPPGAWDTPKRRHREKVHERA